MRHLSAILLVSILSLSVVKANAFTMDLQGGVANAVSDITSFNLNFYGHLWFPIDQQLFFGLGSGYEELDNVAYIPASVSAWVRLPVGRQIMPVVTGDFGYMFGKDHQIFWKAGGGFDIKNGDCSSILLMGGFESLEGRGKGYVYLQAGILVEI